MCCCYRDTKMEIQGLTDAQNTHYQHGVPRRTGLSPPGKATETRSAPVSNENEVGDLSESRELHSDNNNNRPRTSPFRLLAENGSGACLPSHNKQNGKINNTQQQQLQTQTTNIGLRNVTISKEYNELQPPADFVRCYSKYDVGNEDSVLQMALPLFEGEDGYPEHSQQRQQQLPRVLRQQQQDGATQQQSLVSETSAVAPRSNSNVTATSNVKDNEEFYVVFNIVQEGDGNNANKDRVLSKDGEKVNGKKADSSNTKTLNSMEVQNTPVLIESDDNMSNLTTRTLAKTAPLSNLISSGANSERICEAANFTLTNARQYGMCFEADNGNIVLANEYGENVFRHHPLCNEIMSDNSITTSAELQVPGELSSESECKNSATALISEYPDLPEAVEMTDVSNNSSEYISDLVSLAASGSNLSAADRASGGAATGSAAHETFSGTIMINNQSIIVTIENGVLTLAAPPEGYVYKEDGMVSLKEHLGMKEHEDIVLLNYDSGTKSIGKISNVAMTASSSLAAGSSHPDEPRAGLSVSDSELALADDCSSLSELGAALDSCTSIKQEDGALCPIDEADDPMGAAACPKGVPVVCDDDELQPMNLISAAGLAKKGDLVTYRCPQPSCPNTFDTRQKLKMHLVFHTEDQRPFKCTVEGCGWSFTTSYKLKRHLQSHDKVRPYRCEWENCGRRFTTVYNLKAHVKAHDQEDAFVCEICSERFRSATRLANHQRAHFEPERPHKCEFPGCEKTFITFSALFSHNRTHFRETGQFTCTYPGCDKRYDKACRLKIHLRSHTGERPFVCDSEACGWTFTSMSKLLRHKRKHDDDRRFTCPEEGCGKSFTRAEHLKGHSITHLGTKPFECHVEGCSAKFSARSSLYIHSKKHRQDGVDLRSRCPVAGCIKHFSSRSSLKSHMLKHHNLSADVLSQLETTTTLTPSSELTSAGGGPSISGVSGSAGADLASLDLSSLFSGAPLGASGGPAGGPAFTMDMSLVSNGILTIDPASVGATLGAGKPGDPLILAAGGDMIPHGLDGGPVGVGGLPQGALSLDDVQTVNPGALGSLTALAMPGAAATEQLHALGATATEQLHALSASSALTAEPPSSLTPSLSSSLAPSLSSTALVGAPGAELLSAQPKADVVDSVGAGGPLLGGGVEVLGQAEGSKGMSPFVFPAHAATYSGQKETEMGSGAPCPFMESGGSARTDYRAIQLAKNRKQKGPGGPAGGSGAGQRNRKCVKGTSTGVPLAPTSARFGEGTAAANGGLTLRDPVTGAQYVQIQLLQDDPASDGDLAFQLSSQTSSSHTPNSLWTCQSTSCRNLLP